jgi:hypothetical protein
MQAPTKWDPDKWLYDAILLWQIPMRDHSNVLRNGKGLVQGQDANFGWLWLTDQYDKQALCLGTVEGCEILDYM